MGEFFSHPHKRMSTDRVKNNSENKSYKKGGFMEADLHSHKKSTSSKYISNKSNIYTISQRGSHDLGSSSLSRDQSSDKKNQNTS